MWRLRKCCDCDAVVHTLFIENFYSSHVVIKYNKSSNGTKKNKIKKIQRQCYVDTNERTCILRPDHVKKSTQQSLLAVRSGIILQSFVNSLPVLVF